LHFDKDGKLLHEVNALADPGVVQGDDGDSWTVGDNNVIYVGPDGKEVARVTRTNGRAEVVRGKDGVWWVVDKSSVTCFDKDGKQTGRVTGLSNPEIIQGDDGDFWIVDDNNAILVSADGEPIFKLERLRHRPAVRKLGDNWLVTSGSQNAVVNPTGRLLSTFESTGGRADLGANNDELPDQPTLVGDMDQNHQLNDRDIDELASATHHEQYVPHFDLDGNGDVNFDDVRFLVESLFGTVPGDANLDGVFDSSDLIQIFQHGQFEDGIANNSGWASGDWTGDGEFDTADLIMAFQMGSYSEADLPAANALATDIAGNREAPGLGVTAQDDGTSVNLGAPQTVPETTLPNFGIAPEPTPEPSTNPLFTSAEQLIPAADVVFNAPEFDEILRPFVGRAFATGIEQSFADIGPMAIVETPDGEFIISGGASRSSLFRFGSNGGEAFNPWAELPYPIFNMAFDGEGRLWATTGGGPLLQLDPDTGAILGEHGDGITMALAIDPTTGLI